MSRCKQSDMDDFMDASTQTTTTDVITAPDLCKQIVKCVANMWTDQTMFDFTVKTGDETIPCHRFVLAACSDFFQGLFRSGMREVTENCVVLDDISSDVFHIILETLYTGANLLTLENVFEVWRAVHQLQIQFMIHSCEDFAIEANTLEMWGKIYTNANFLDSEKVLGYLYPFMLKNFEKISLTPAFLQLSFEELKALIRSQDLVVGKEDSVLEAVIRWVSFVPIVMAEFKDSNCALNAEVCREENSSIINSTLPESNVKTELIKNVKISRKDKLTELLKKVRTCLVSPSLLSHVYNMKLISENKDSRDIIVKALLYQVEELRQTHWPSSALHRSCSGYTHGGLFVEERGTFKFISADEEKIYELSKGMWLRYNIQLAPVRDEIYCIGRYQYNPSGVFTYYVFSKNEWNYVMTVPIQNMLFFSHRDLLYILDKDNRSIHHRKPKDNQSGLEVLTKFTGDVNVTLAVTIEDCILLFCSETQNGLDETAVLHYDIVSKVWTRLDNLEGPAEHLISFKNDTHTYILQTNGCMLEVLYSMYTRDFEFKFLAKLWTAQKKLYGALTYKNKLIIFGKTLSDDPAKVPDLTEVSNHFKHIKYMEIVRKCSNVASVVLPTSSLRQGIYYT
ncbi:kelch-like protein 40 [Physella acuta]|uniref:kelch-like protein 40 n=1 Tax=Physella acuta TaxID=109671 RepID=UPI0027DDB7E0|nr:kelch-like protein 40 [Physella acuta]